jgi:hypothetical protein
MKKDVWNLWTVENYPGNTTEKMLICKSLFLFSSGVYFLFLPHFYILYLGMFSYFMGPPRMRVGAGKLGGNWENSSKIDTK